MTSTEEAKRVAYCKQHNVHHLFELLATRLLVERPENPFHYLRHLLLQVEESEKKSKLYDPTVCPPISSESCTTTVQRRKIILGTFGIENAGKTTLISALGGKIERNTTPTIGFTPTKFQTEKHDICIFDLGGASNFRGIWMHYFHDCHGLIYVIDSAAEEDVVRDSLNVLRGMAQHPYVRGKPILLLANKKDLEKSRRADVLPDHFLEEILEPGTAYRVASSCGIEEDSELDAGVEWLLTTVDKMYDVLETRVQRDTDEVKKEAKKNALERLSRVNTSVE